MRFSVLVLLPVSFAALAAAGPIFGKRASFTVQNGKDAQALNAKFQSLNADSSCSPGENAITCDTEQDAAERISRTGATGGLRGRDLEARAAPFVLQNGKDAQALNRKFQTLTTDSPCQPGENACVNGNFAQCANGKFVTFPCNTGLTCMALPLVLSPGTSLVCDTQADVQARIAATGATGGVFGR